MSDALSGNRAKRMVVVVGLLAMSGCGVNHTFDAAPIKEQPGCFAITERSDDWKYDHWSGKGTACFTDHTPAPDEWEQDIKTRPQDEEKADE